MSSFLTLILSLLAVSLATCDTGYKANDVVVPEKALTCLRSLQIPDTYKTICATAHSFFENYVFLDQLKTGGEYPETKYDLLAGLDTACEEALKLGNTFDFNMAMLTATQKARDGHTAWTVPSSTGAFSFLSPLTVVFSQPEKGGAVKFELAKNQIVENRLDAYRTAYDAAYGEGEFDRIHALAGKTLEAINDKEPAVFFSEMSKEAAFRTEAQRAAALMGTWGNHRLTRGMSPKQAIELVQAGFTYTVGGQKYNVKVMAVAAYDVTDEVLSHNEFADGQNEVAGTSHPRFLGVSEEENERTLLAARDAAINDLLSNDDEDGRAAPVHISDKGLVNCFIHKQTKSFILQITTYHPILNGQGLENEWLDDMHVCLQELRKSEYDDPEKGRLVVDVRNNGGGWIDLATATIDALSGGKGTLRAQGSPRALYPKVFARVYNRAVLDGKRPVRIYDEKLPLFKSEGGDDHHEQWLKGEETTHLTFLGADAPSEALYTIPRFYTNLPNYNAHIKRITGQDEWVLGEFPKNAWEKLIRLGSFDYDLRNTYENTVVVIGAGTASCGAFTAHNLKQLGFAKVVASTGLPTNLENGAQDQVGFVPGGDTIDLGLFQTWYPEQWKNMSKGVWPTKAGMQMSNFAVMTYLPWKQREDKPYSREFLKEPADAVIFHANPVMGLVTEGQYAWGSTLDAGIFAQKLQDSGIWDKECTNNGYRITAIKNHALVGQRCVDGKFAEKEEVLGCQHGYEFNRDNTKPMSMDCQRIVCPSGSNFDNVSLVCAVGAPKPPLPTWVIISIAILCVAVCSIIAFAAWIIVKKRRGVGLLDGEAS